MGMRAAGDDGEVRLEGTDRRLERAWRREVNEVVEPKLAFCRCCTHGFKV
jgi:hypothetical protein